MSFKLLRLVAVGLYFSVGAPALSQTLEAHWKLNASSGTTAVDYSGNGHTGTVTGTATWVSAMCQNGFSFNGSTKIQATGLLGNSASLSVMAWVNLTTADSSGAEVISLGDHFMLRLDEGGTTTKGIMYDGSGWQAVALAQTFEGNGWHHIAIVFDDSANSFKIYVDGALEQTATIWNSISYSGLGTNTVIGRHGNGQTNLDFTGTIDDVRVYDYAVSAADILDIYGRLAHWKLNESSGSSAADSSAYERTGAVTGTASWSSAVLQNGFSFNGSTKIEESGLLGSPSSFTLAAWANLTAADTSGADIISLGNRVYLRLDESGSAKVAFYNGSSYVTASYAVTYAGRGWHHFAGVFNNSANTLKLYIDGVQVASTSTTSNITYSGAGSNTVIGRHGNASTSYDFTGMVDDVHAYNYALSAAQIVELYGLIGRWKLNESSGTTASDSSGMGNNGTYQNGVTLAQAGPFTGGTEVAAQFDGSNDYVSVGNITSGLGEGFTIAAWARPTNTGSWQRIVDFGRGEDVDNVFFGRSGTTTNLTLRIHDGSIGTGTLTATDALETNVWHHYVGTCDSAGNAKIYRDGLLMASGNIGVPADVTRTSNYIGRSNWAFDAYYRGRLFDVRLYNRPITAAEVAELYGLLGYWKFDEGTGTTISDASGSANDAAFNNGSPDWVSGVRDAALEFNGTTDDAMTDDDLVPPETGTVVFWFRSNGPPSARQRHFGLGNDWEAWQDPDGILRLDLCGDGDSSGLKTLDAVSTASTWYHIAAVYDSVADTYALYLNGELHTSGAYALSAQAGGKLSFGTRTGSTERFAGALDDFRVYSRKLSQAEIYQIFGLAAWYKLDETSGTTAVDSTGLGNNGTYSGSPTLGAAGNGAASLGTAVDFNGSNYVQASGLYDSTASVSVAAWAKLDASDTSGADVISLGDHLRLRLQNGTTGAQAAYYNGSSWITVSASQIIVATGWHHYAAVLRENDTLKLYIDGVEAASISLSGAISYAGLGSNTRIASHGNGSTAYDLDGRIDDVRVYNRAMTPDEAYWLYRGSRIDGIKILQWVEAR
jgi:hypothetical protein